MSAFGKEVEVKEGSAIKLYTGAENFKVVAVNPTKTELESMYGRELNFTPEYIGTTKVTDGDGEREVGQIRLDFFLANEDNSITTKIQFYIGDTHHKSASGKYRVINSFGKDTWLTGEAIKDKDIPDNMSWYNTDGLKVAKRGEIELISFLVNLLNLPFNLDKVSDVSEAYARIDKDNWEKIFKGDVGLLKSIIDGTNNKIGVLLGVKTKGDGKLVQACFNKHTLRQFTIPSNKATKFKWLAKDLEESKAAGSFGNVEFGKNDFILCEHQITPTVISSDNTNQVDIFATADAGSESEDPEGWL
jgi:hypothetical protein|tara:strand:+ start:1122 stop:2030 length:909 start_codon:yes stop_codon:yes gene_type:complete